MTNQTPPGSWPCFFQVLLPHHPGPVRKHSPPASHLLLVPLLWRLLGLEIFQDYITFNTPHPFWPYPLSFDLFHGFLDWLCCNSYEVMHEIWSQFSPAGMYCFRLDDIWGFFYNNGIFNGAIPPEFPSGFSSIVLTILFMKYRV